MPTILFDHSRWQFRRWLLRNSPAIPIALAIALVFYITDHETIRLIVTVFGCLCLFIILWGAIFRRILLYPQDGQIVCEYRFLGLLTIERQVAALTDLALVRYHTWQQPLGNDRSAYFAAIYLHFKEAKPWRIADQAHYSLDPESDEIMAEALAQALEIPVEKVAHPPVV